MRIKAYHKGEETLNFSKKVREFSVLRQLSASAFSETYAARKGDVGYILRRYIVGEGMSALSGALSEINAYLALQKRHLPDMVSFSKNPDGPWMLVSPFRFENLAPSENAVDSILSFLREFRAAEDLSLSLQDHSARVDRLVTMAKSLSDAAAIEEDSAEEAISKILQNRERMESCERTAPSVGNLFRSNIYSYEERAFALDLSLSSLDFPERDLAQLFIWLDAHSLSGYAVKRYAEIFGEESIDKRDLSLMVVAESIEKMFFTPDRNELKGYEAAMLKAL